MGRPLYETRGTLRIERIAIDAFAKFTETKQLNLPLSYQVDAFMQRNKKTKAVVEFKGGNTPERLPHRILPVQKWEALRRWGNSLSVPAYMLVFIVGTLRYHLIEPIHRYDVLEKGRADRGDAADYEPCIIIPRDRFIEVPSCYTDEVEVPEESKGVKQRT